MAQLVILPNDTNKDQDTQNKQISIDFQDITRWSNQILSRLLVDYTEPQAAADESSTSTTFVPLSNFTKNFTVNNALCTININLSLKGIGFIQLIVNDQELRKIPFQNAGFSPFIYNANHQLRNGANQIIIKWAATTGTVTKANSATNQGLNFIQVTSINS